MLAPRHLHAIAAFATVLGLWWAASRFGWIGAFLLPPPGKVLTTLIEMAQSGELARHTLVSLQRVGVGYLLAVALAVLLAVVFSKSAITRQLLDSLLEFLRQVPPLALMPLLMLWLGIGEAQKVGIIVLACFFPIFLGMRGGIAQVDPKLIEVGKVCGLSDGEILWRIVLPSSLPSIVVGLRIGLGYSWRALVGAELIASSAGLGYLIVDAENLARTDIVLAGIFVIGAIGILADQLLKRGIVRAAPWLATNLEAARA
ncbi:sulfonate transport system permease protein [Mycoplana sp. BE70]|uniref:ABC transporter permease n=1 Tax=Mycoplana sp. BE70 TaxID=2817775 RepID=UPI002861C78D|nr:ABC transporter permease [Mycoplana sp. BE70]MDR6755588.1 sulfonate transport system permease protein [Mycoplana sp. BE70]